MSGSSDSDEFYDAEDLTPNRNSRKHKNGKEITVISRTDSESSVSIKENETELRPDQETCNAELSEISQEPMSSDLNAAETEDMFDNCEDNLPLSTFLRNINSEIPSDCDYNMYAIIDDDLITSEVQTEDEIVSEVKNKGHSDDEEEEEQDKEEKNKVPVPTEGEKKITGSHGRDRFRKLRQRMQTEDEDMGLNNTSPPDSQTSSVEGVFAVPSKTSHPFRIIEHDALSLQSITSLGRALEPEILVLTVTSSETGALKASALSLMFVKNDDTLSVKICDLK
ncbi:hypothetical protein C0J52_23327 [Blattella germanica]|nr:hypothetical protein C0J52_23327 [Blattella germanica]